MGHINNVTGSSSYFYSLILHASFCYFTLIQHLPYKFG